MLSAIVHYSSTGATHLVILQGNATSTGTLIQSKATSTSTSMQSDKKRSNLEHQYLFGTNYLSTNQITLEQFIQICNSVIPKFFQRTIWIFFSFPPVCHLDPNHNLNFSLTQRDNILLVTFLNQSTSH